MYAFICSKEHLELAQAEISALHRVKTNDSYVVIAADGNYIDRMAYTKKGGKLLFSCEKKDLERLFSKYPWEKVYKKNFCVRVYGDSNMEKRLAAFVWNTVTKPQVDLKNPSCSIECYTTAKKTYCILSDYSQDEDFNSRKPHKRPMSSPVSLHPKLARCMVNLSGIKKGKVTDPFCGTGGILIEAGLMGLKPVGYDINPWMIKAAKANLEHYMIQDYKLEQRDALTIQTKTIVTDLPYGRNTKPQDIEKLLKKVLKTTKNGVIGVPSNIKIPKYIKKKFNYYLHKSLSKKVLVF